MKFTDVTFTETKVADRRTASVYCDNSYKLFIIHYIKTDTYDISVFKKASLEQYILLEESYSEIHTTKELMKIINKINSRK